MKRLDEFGEKLEIAYPCAWVYKVIGRDQVVLENAISEIMQDAPYRLTLSNTSRTKKYIALNLQVTVEHEEARNAIYTKLKDRAEIRMVL